MSENNWKEMILPEYEVRKSKAQKARFVDMLSEKYGDRLRVEETRGLIKSRNVIIGNPERAKVVFTAHYDTAPVMPFPNFITPKNIPVYLLYQLLLVLVIYIPVALVVGVSMYLTRGLSESVQIIINEAVFFASLIGIMWFLLDGPANRHTANDNTSGVVAVLTLADRLTSDDFAFILFDNEERGLLGSSSYAAAHKSVRENTMIVNLDCISDGDHVMFLISKKASGSAYAAALESMALNVLGEYGKSAIITGPRGTVYPSDQRSFKVSIGVAALKKSPSRLIGYYMDRIHTKRDTQFDGANIAAICDLLEKAAAALT